MAPDNTELLLLVGRMDGKLDTLMTTVLGLTERVAKLEAWNTRLIIMAATSGGGAGLSFSYISKLLGLVTGTHS